MYIYTQMCGSGRALKLFDAEILEFIKSLKQFPCTKIGHKKNISLKNLI